VAITIADCRKAANVVRTMLRRIQSQLGIEIDGLDLQDDSAQSGLASSYGEQESPEVAGATQGNSSNSSSDTYSGNIGIELSESDFANFGMADPNILAMQDHDINGAQHDVNMADPWGFSQMQNGYDWVSVTLFLSCFLLYFY
jgi:hypothetical protein